MLKVAVLVSGGGTNLQAILDAVETGRIRNAEVVAVISNNPQAYALERAKKHGIPAVCVSRKPCGSGEAFDDALLRTVRNCGVILSGRKILLLHSQIPPAFSTAQGVLHPCDKQKRDITCPFFHRMLI